MVGGRLWSIDGRCRMSMVDGRSTVYGKIYLPRGGHSWWLAPKIHQMISSRHFATSGFSPLKHIDIVHEQTK